MDKQVIVWIAVVDFIVMAQCRRLLEPIFAQKVTTVHKE